MAKPIRLDESGDSADLQSLFDSIAGGAVPAVLFAEPDPSGDSADLQALFDSVSEQVTEYAAAACADADAHERLDDCARVTGQDGNRVLHATEVARSAQDELEQGVKTLGMRWEKLFANQLSVDEFKQLATDTRGFFAAASASVAITDTQLNEIMRSFDRPGAGG